MRARIVVVCLIILALGTLLPGSRVLAVGPVTNWPWLGTYGCQGGYILGTVPELIVRTG